MRYHSENNSLTDSHCTRQWLNALLEAAEMSGREPLVGPKLLDWVKEAGFQEVTEHIFTLPIGRWPKDAKLREIGLLNLTLILDGLEAFSMRLLCSVAGWEQDDVRTLLDGVRGELTSGAFHAQIKL